MTTQPRVVAATFLFMTMLTSSARGQSTGAAGGTAAQIQGAPAKPLAFDVVSVKKSPANSTGERMGLTPDGIQLRNQPLEVIIRETYGLAFGGQIVGAPDWIASERFDIEAKVSGDDAQAFHKLNLDQVREMFRPVLADRFKLVAHNEARTLPVYALVIAKGGPKLKPSTPEEMAPNEAKGGDAVARLGRIGMGRMQTPDGSAANRLTAQAVPTARLAMVLAQQGLDRLVVDKTGLTGNYDFVLTWNPNLITTPDASSTEDPSLSIFTAIQEQLGLKLEPDKGPVPVLVIDHVERPAEN